MVYNPSYAKLPKWDLGFWEICKGNQWKVIDSGTTIHVSNTMQGFLIGLKAQALWCCPCLLNWRPVSHSSFPRIIHRKVRISVLTTIRWQSLTVSGHSLDKHVYDVFKEDTFCQFWWNSRKIFEVKIYAWLLQPNLARVKIVNYYPSEVKIDMWVSLYHS